MERKQKKIKILFTIPNFDTAGSGKALLNIAKGLDQKYFEPHIACLHDKGVGFKNIEKSGLPVHILQYIVPMAERIKGLIQCWKISRTLKEINPDLIHSFHYAPDYSEALAARMAGIPWVFTKKNMNWGGKSKNGWRLRSYLARHIIIQNTDMRMEFYPTSSNTTLIPRGVNLHEFSPKSSNNNSVEYLGIPRDSKVIMVIANLVPVKGIEYLIEAFDLMCEKKKSFYIVIIGDDNNNYAKNLKKIAEKKYNGHKILFTGKRQDIPDLLKLAYVFVLPTLNQYRREGSPVVLLEAMAAGIPVLASNVSGSRDILSNIPNQLFSPEDVSSLEDKLNWIINLDKENRDDLIKSQLEILNEKYAIEREIEQHELLYKNILQQ